MSHARKPGSAPPQQWGRLKAVREDPLEKVGLPSKGDTSLLTFEAQEQYFVEILSRAKSLQSATSKTLEGALDGLDLRDVRSPKELSGRSSSDDVIFLAGAKASDTSTLVQAMRKLREAIIATNRKDRFASDVYFWIIRATIVLGHFESYHPALLRVFRLQHTHIAFLETHLQELQSYLILDLACRQNNFNEAYMVLSKCAKKPVNVAIVVNAVVQQNWIAFWSIQQKADQFQQRLMSYAVPSIRRHTIDCLSRSYLTLSKLTIESLVHQEYDDFAGRNSLNWPVDGGSVVFKAVKKRQ